MKLNCVNFFRELILCPWKADRKDLCKTYTASLAIGILSLGSIHLACAVIRCCVTYHPPGSRTPEERRMTAAAKKSLQPQEKAAPQPVGVAYRLGDPGLLEAQLADRHPAGYRLEDPGLLAALYPPPSQTDSSFGVTDLSDLGALKKLYPNGYPRPLPASGTSATSSS